MDFRVNVVVEVDQVGNGLAVRTPVVLDLVRTRAGWLAESEKPAIQVDEQASMEEAIIVGGQAVATELQGAVEHRPLIVGRILPEQVAEFF